MQDPKKLYGHQEWPPLTSVGQEATNSDDDCQQEVKDKLEEGR